MISNARFISGIFYFFLGVFVNLQMIRSTILILFSSFTLNVVTLSNDVLNDSIYMKKMTIEIWSDIVCPFCYIGKTRFDEALKTFEHRDQVEVIWRSFLLNPDQKTDTTISIHQYLVDSKGWTLPHAKEVGKQVTEMAAESGLSFHFDSVIVASSVKAHQLMHLGNKHNLASQLKTLLFRAYFTEGKNIDDKAVLSSLATEVGLPSDAVSEVLSTDKYLVEVNKDIALAQQMGVRGVPFFVYLGKYVVNGAQDTETFKRALNRGWEEFIESNPEQKKIVLKDGVICAPDGKCD